MFKMIVKLAAMVTLLGVCCCLPVEDPKAVEVASNSGLVPLEPKPVKVEGLPEPPKPDDSDLKADASTWWHSWYQYKNPVVIYYPEKVPEHYTYYWKTHF